MPRDKGSADISPVILKFRLVFSNLYSRSRSVHPGMSKSLILKNIYLTPNLAFSGFALPIAKAYTFVSPHNKKVRIIS